MPSYVAAIDQGTTSTRLILFDEAGGVAAVEQREHSQLHPRAGWVEHDPAQVWQRTQEVIEGALAARLRRARRRRRDRHHQPARDDRRVGPAAPASRCTTRSCGRTRAPPPWCTSWRDQRAPTGCARASGLPLSTYFSGPKITWILENVDGARERAESGELAFGTMDTLDPVEPHRRPGRRRPRDRRDQRQPHAADGPADAAVASAQPRADGHPRVDAPGDPLLERALRTGRAAPLWPGGRSPASSATSRRPCSARRASRRARRSAPTEPARSCCVNTGREIVRSSELLTSVAATDRR